MSELTKEHFDQQLGKLVTKKDFEVVLDDRFKKQAILINSAFQEQGEHFTRLIADLQHDLDGKIDKLDGRLQTVETKLDRALYTELTHLESRLRRVEEKVGIKPQNPLNGGFLLGTNFQGTDFGNIISWITFSKKVGTKECATRSSPQK